MVHLAGKGVMQVLTGGDKSYCDIGSHGCRWLVIAEVHVRWRGGWRAFKIAESVNTATGTRALPFGEAVRP